MSWCTFSTKNWLRDGHGTPIPDLRVCNYMYLCFKRTIAVEVNQAKRICLLV